MCPEVMVGGGGDGSSGVKQYSGGDGDRGVVAAGMVMMMPEK